MSLVLHGHPVSQPSRSVQWLLLSNGIPHTLKTYDPISGETKSKEFLAMNPSGTIPVLEDNGFFLFESAAILIYLAEKYQWTTLFPTDLQTRARINQYLHWHHANTRLCSTALFRPAFISILKKLSAEETEKQLENGKKAILKVSRVITSFLTQNEFLAAPHPTLADYLCYCEIDQLVVMKLFDFSEFPLIQKWMGRMAELPHHAEVQQGLHSLVERLEKRKKRSKM
jgi:glutathione S-transferase